MNKHIITIIFILSSSHVFACNSKYQEWSLEYLISNNHLVNGPLSIQEIEAKHTYIPAGETESIPFGNSNINWLKFISNHQVGDELYFVKYNVGENYADKYLLIRNKCIISSHLLGTGALR